MTEQKNGRSEQIRKALDVCCTWVEYVNGDRRKDCDNCPYRDPADPAGLNCGERLMHDACELIGDLQREIRKLKTELNILRNEPVIMESEAKRIP